MALLLPPMAGAFVAMDWLGGFFLGEVGHAGWTNSLRLTDLPNRHNRIIQIIDGWRRQWIFE
jgi:hypothetical protein